MRVHANFTKNEQVEDLYFINPVEVYDEDISLNEALNIAEKAQDNDQYAIVAVTYESHDRNRERFIVGIFDEPVTREAFLNTHKIDGYRISEYKMSEAQETIEENIEAVRNYIRDGDTYQANYTTRMHGEFKGDAHTLYERLTRENNGGYTVYISHKGLEIVSCSPELFFEIDSNNIIRTRPMKGTAPRGENPKEDLANYEFLRQSKKDHAENVMIVDLLRNDISRVSKPGTVHTPKLFTIEHYKTVFQMTSTVEGELKDNLSFSDIFSSLFPCGSITGAPKLKTMEIIETLESSPRGYYCGAIGILYKDHTTIFNVPIRTLVIENNMYTYAAGGGITYNSHPTSEYYEILAKTKFLEQAYYTLIETMRLEHGKVKRLELHDKRLNEAAKHFGLFEISLTESVEFYIQEKMLYEGTYRLRATYDDTLILTHERLTDMDYIEADVLPISAPQEFLEYKTSIRDHYVTKHHSYALYYDENKRMTEFNIGNLVVKEHGNYYTPTSGGLLNGVMRQSLLDNGKIKEYDYDLNTFKSLYNNKQIEVYLINSLREWVLVKLQF